MHNLKNFEEEIYKCSRCGLCQSVCPVYKATLNECSVSKAKFTMLNGIIKGDLRLNDKIKSYMDLCTGCNACKDFCPSGIDARKIFLAVKEEYHSLNKRNLFNRLIDSYSCFKICLVFAKASFFFYRVFCFDKLFSIFQNLFYKFGGLGKRLILLNSLIKKNRLSNQRKNCELKKTKKAVFFKGCFNQYLNSESEEAVKEILRKSNVEVIDVDFECCGVSYLNDGQISTFKKIAKKNIEKLRNLECDYIITDCASCLDTLKSYSSYFSAEELSVFSNKVISVVDLIKSFKFSLKESVIVSAHKPCHDSYEFIDIIKNIENINYVESVDYDKCCGFAGKFALKNSEISRKISDTKAQYFCMTNADYILTTCPACLLGLNQGLIEAKESISSLGKKRPVPMNLFVFLAKYCEIR